MRPGRAIPSSGRTRGLLNHGAGKGDKNRTVMNQNYRDNYDAIDWRIPGGIVAEMVADFRKKCHNI